MRRWLVRGLLLLALAAAGAALAARIVAGHWSEPLAIGAQAHRFEFTRGTTVTDLARTLHAAGVLRHPWSFLALVRYEGVGAKLRAGEYDLPPTSDSHDLLRLLLSGRVVHYPFTIIEGWTFADLRRALASAPVLRPLTSGLTDAGVMRRLGLAGRHPEGWFLPDTYLYTRGQSDLDLLRRAHLALDRELAAAWAARAPDLPFANPEEMLILASIVEKETALGEERARIAGVFVRRLRLGMRLQTDPTVIYGLGAAFDGNLRRRDLEADNPYNTYRRTGLPPTPIALPGRAAIRAASMPAGGSALYFVARGDGSHEFSDTLQEHNAAVARYQLGQGQ